MDMSSLVPQSIRTSLLVSVWISVQSPCPTQIKLILTDIFLFSFGLFNIGCIPTELTGIAGGWIAKQININLARRKSQCEQVERDTTKFQHVLHTFAWNLLCPLQRLGNRRCISTCLAAWTREQQRLGRQQRRRQWTLHDNLNFFEI